MKQSKTKKQPGVSPRRSIKELLAGGPGSGRRPETKAPAPQMITDEEHEADADRLGQELVGNLNRYVLEEQHQDLLRQQKVKK